MARSTSSIRVLSSATRLSTSLENPLRRSLSRRTVWSPPHKPANEHTPKLRTRDGPAARLRRMARPAVLRCVSRLYGNLYLTVGPTALEAAAAHARIIVSHHVQHVLARFVKSGG